MGESICIISPEDLLLFKIKAGRNKDIEDIQSVVARQENHLDYDYIFLQADKFNIPKDILVDLLKEKGL
jgi:predicted nucleotidyltransferase